jgi:mannose-6-phosphate isomerase-like protein (cupin superfamily)
VITPVIQAPSTVADLAVAVTNVTSTQNAEHYTWGDNCDGWFLLKDPGVHLIQECMPPNAVEKLHFHNRSRQFFYVLPGELSMLLGQERLLIRAGEGLAVEPKLPHEARNSSRENVEFIVMSCPPSHDDRTNIH